MADIVAARIAQLRGLAGLSKTDLASRLGVTPSAVSQWESGAKQPGLDKILVLANALGAPATLLQRALPHSARAISTPVSFRARASARTGRARDRARSLALLTAEVFGELAKSIKLPAFSLPELAGEASVELIDEFAEATRTAWGMEMRPILRLGDLLESKGIILSEVEFGDERYDAFSCILDGLPLIFLGSDKGDRARRRFDAAHELGHLLIHQHLTQEEFDAKDTLTRVEKEANAFASAFLLPRKTFLADLEMMSDKSLVSFLRLKSRWGVSAQAMIRRARELNAIDETHYTQLCRAAAMRRWRGAKKEPGDELVPEIKPTLGSKAITLLGQAGIMQRWQLMEELPMPSTVWRAVAGLNSADIRPAELDTIVPFSTTPDERRINALV
jgi:Zn-dependent peptidase ImmA (M78 family)/DNA-binding XRE family transcriptional regulator